MIKPQSREREGKHEDEVVLPGGDAGVELLPHVVRGEVVRARADPGVDNVHIVDAPPGDAQERGQAVLPAGGAGEE
eukprot:10036503-Alexandrium_andersonii.AAC.1